MVLHKTDGRWQPIPTPQPAFYSTDVTEKTFYTRRRLASGSAIAIASSFGVRHLRHSVFLANWESPQAPHVQSPSNWTGPTPSGRTVPHFRHSVLRQNCRSPQVGHIQSLGFAKCGRPIPASAGLGSPHFLHCKFLANCISPHAGQFQSPLANGKPPPPRPPLRCASIGFGVRHFAHA